MAWYGPSQYETFEISNQTSQVILCDHLGGFDMNLKSPVLDRLAMLSEGRPIKVVTEYIVDQRIKDNYPNFNFVFSIELQQGFLGQFDTYNIHPLPTFQNFLCSFNGAPHVSRKLLVSVLKRFDWFEPRYCSKNFAYSVGTLDGHLQDHIDKDQFYRKFFISPDSDEFFNTVFTFGHQQFDHKKNIHNLETKLTESFLHIVSETLATSYYPLVTEKFLYSVVTRGLFLTYAQPGWHDYLEQYYGFKKYTKLFDYRFDSILNPVERLVELMSMISKFSVLDPDDWRDLYEMEYSTIEYNYDHYHSGRYQSYYKQQ